MPLSAKGAEILASMKQEYGETKGEEVFYASKNAGTITGVDADEAPPVSQMSIPSSLTPKEINERNRKYWGQLNPNSSETGSI